MISSRYFILVMLSLSVRGFLNGGPKRLISKSLFSQLTEQNNAVDTSLLNRIKINKIFKPESKRLVNTNIIIKGWVRTVRNQKKFAFIEVNDGSSLNGIQVVVDESIPSFDEVSRLSTGAAVEVIGTLVESIGKGQTYEVKAIKLFTVGTCPPEYPLQKKRHSQEFLRTIAHLRPRTNTISAVARVRSALAYATHTYFQGEGFHYLQSPLITASDCEGAGEMFRVTTLPIETPDLIPTIKQNISSSTDSAPSSAMAAAAVVKTTDFSKDFFSKPAYLTVSGQLSGEAYASALGDIYTFGPTFRAENSQTTRHLAEFHMIEPEMAFADLWDAMTSAEQFIKHTVKYAVETCPDDLLFFQKFFDAALIERLQRLIDPSVPFPRVAYRDAIVMLQEEIAKDPSKWQYPDVSFGTDLNTEHERWLAEKKFNSCVFVHNYPKEIKAFYMRDNNDGQTVDSFDLLVPGVGELVGGSQREERLDTLKVKLANAGLKEEDYWWYLDLRRFGSVPHSGYGLGFERLVCYVTGIENIREAIAFPRFPGSAEF